MYTRNIRNKIGEDVLTEKIGIYLQSPILSSVERMSFRKNGRNGVNLMWRLLPWLLGLLVVLTIVVLGYALLADLTPPSGPVIIPVVIPEN